MRDANVNHLFKLSVEHVDRTERGFICQCAEYGNPDCTERFVPTADLLRHLGADSRGLITIVTTFDNAEGEPVDYEQQCTLDEWLDDHSGLDLEIELGILLNKAEGRIANPPLPEMSDLGKHIFDLADSLNVAYRNSLTSKVA